MLVESNPYQGNALIVAVNTAVVVGVIVGMISKSSPFGLLINVTTVLILETNPPVPGSTKPRCLPH